MDAMYKRSYETGQYYKKSAIKKDILGRAMIFSKKTNSLPGAENT